MGKPKHFYPSRPGYRRDGASREAAEHVAGKAKTVREQVFDTLTTAPRGLTTDECAARLGREPWELRPRMSELVAAKRVIETPERRQGKSGLRISVWAVVPAANDGGVE